VLFEHFLRVKLMGLRIMRVIYAPWVTGMSWYTLIQVSVYIISQAKKYR